MDLLYTRNDLAKYIAAQPNAPKDYDIAVAILIFTDDDKVVLLERGPKARDGQGQLEGVGGALEGEENLIDGLQREIQEEIGEVVVSIEQFFGVKFLMGQHGKYWAVVEHAGRLQSGTPRVMEPDKTSAVKLVAFAEMDGANLTSYQMRGLEMYREEFGNKPYYRL